MKNLSIHSINPFKSELIKNRQLDAKKSIEGTKSKKDANNPSKGSKNAAYRKFKASLDQYAPTFEAFNENNIDFDVPSNHIIIPVAIKVNCFRVQIMNPSF